MSHLLPDNASTWAAIACAETAGRELTTWQKIVKSACIKTHTFKVHASGTALQMVHSPLYAYTRVPPPPRVQRPAHASVRAPCTSARARAMLSEFRSLQNPA